MDTERIEALAGLMAVDIETRLLRDIVSRVTEDDWKLLKARVIAKIEERLISEVTRASDWKVEERVKGETRTAIDRLVTTERITKLAEKHTTDAALARVVDAEAPASIRAVVLARIRALIPQR